MDKKCSHILNHFIAVRVFQSNSNLCWSDFHSKYHLVCIWLIGGRNENFDPNTRFNKSLRSQAHHSLLTFHANLADRYFQIVGFVIRISRFPFQISRIHEQWPDRFNRLFDPDTEITLFDDRLHAPAYRPTDGRHQKDHRPRCHAPTLAAQKYDGEEWWDSA